MSWLRVVLVRNYGPLSAVSLLACKREDNELDGSSLAGSGLHVASETTAVGSVRAQSS